MQFHFKSVLDDAHEDGEEGGTLGLIFQGNVARKALSTRRQHSFQDRFSLFNVSLSKQNGTSWKARTHIGLTQETSSTSSSKLIRQP